MPKRYRCVFFYSKRQLAFSLIEVVLALAVASFVLLSMIALLPAGFQSTRDSLQESGAINVLSSVITDRKAISPTTATLIYQIPSLDEAASNCFGVTTANVRSSDLTHSLYRVTYVITPPATARMDPYLVYFKVSWPAGAASSAPAGYVEEVVTFPQP